jgi:hypothetical protein
MQGKTRKHKGKHELMQIIQILIHKLKHRRPIQEPHNQNMYLVKRMSNKKKSHLKESKYIHYRQN